MTGFLGLHRLRTNVSVIGARIEEEDAMVALHVPPAQKRVIKLTTAKQDAH
jgi:hypothetical protein